MNTPNKMGRQLAAARTEIQLTTERAGRLQSEVNALQSELAEALKSNRSLMDLRDAMDSERKAAQRQVLRLTRQTIILKEEQDYLRKQLDMLLNEDTIGREGDMAWRARVDELESLVKKYRLQVEQMEEEQRFIKDEKSANSTPLDTTYFAQLNSKIAELQAGIKFLLINHLPLPF